MSLRERLADFKEGARQFFTIESGKKKIFAIKRAGVAIVGGIMALAVGLAWLGPAEDRTHYRQTSEPETATEKPETASSSSGLSGLFDSGEKRKQEEKRAEAERRKRQVAIKYFAPQVIGTNSKEPRAIRTGAKLVAFLLRGIDTRNPGLVSARISKGGEVGGVEIEAGSVLRGEFSYSGSGDKVSVTFSRLDTPDGEPKRIAAAALDAADYTAGLRGETHSDNGVKIAAQMGLTMFSGMADVLTEKESLGGFSASSVQAKPTMKNALLQGLSRSAQDETNRTASEIGSAKDYVIVPEGKEMIIELTEDYHK